MALDFGLLTGLSGKKNWDVVRQQKKDAIAYQTALNAMQEKEISEQQAQQAAMAEYMNTVNSLPVLKPGMERIQEIEKTQLRPQIAEKIKKYGGDLVAYMKVEGGSDMRNYLNSLVNNPVTQKEILNAKQVGLWEADRKAGLMERMHFDPTTGVPIGTMEEQLQKYANGEIDAINYMGAFKPQEFDETVFSKEYGSSNRYKARQVTERDYLDRAFRELVGKGMKEKDAMQQAMMLTSNYKKHLDSKGAPLMYKWDEWKVTDGMSAGERESEEAARYIAERFGRIVTDDPAIWDKVTTPKTGITAPSPVSGVLTQNIPTSPETKQTSALNGVNIGDATIRFKKLNAQNQEEEYFTTVKNKITDTRKQGDKIYIQTEKSKIDAANAGQPEAASYIELTENGIDQLVLGTANPVKAAAALRRALKEMGVYENGIINWGGKKAQQPNAKVVTLKGNEDPKTLVIDQVYVLDGKQLRWNGKNLVKVK